MKEYIKGIDGTDYTLDIDKVCRDWRFGFSIGINTLGDKDSYSFVIRDKVGDHAKRVEVCIPNTQAVEIINRLELINMYSFLKPDCFGSFRTKSFILSEIARLKNVKRTIQSKEGLKKRLELINAYKLALENKTI